ncbi:MAG: alpha/beta-hydrolase family protein [Actinobacteria bacterium]|nr:alpha/beta-hydrolase family protein [Actinomycetota bacterium]
MEAEAIGDPIRVFVGLDTAAEVEDRVLTIMDELVRTKAFEREVLCFASPTGSGHQLHARRGAWRHDPWATARS